MFQTTLCKRRMPPICVSVYHLIVQALFVSRRCNSYEGNWNSTRNEVTRNIKIKMLNQNNNLNNTKLKNTVQGRNKTLPHGKKMEINDNLSHRWKKRMEINEDRSQVKCVMNKLYESLHYQSCRKKAYLLLLLNFKI